MMDELDEKDFIKNLGIYEEGFLEQLLHEISELFIIKDAVRTEYLLIKV